MSLVNDALKRAKQAQKKTSQNPEEGPQLKPLEIAPPRRGGMELLVPALIFLIVAAGIYFFSQLMRQHGSETPAAAPAPKEVTTAPALPVPALKVAARETAPPQNAAQQSSTITVIATESKPSAPSSIVVTADAPAPKPALKLQAVFYDAQHPSAIIAGKTLFVGDRINGYRVAVITRLSVTLISATETNVLSLE